MFLQVHAGCAADMCSIPYANYPFIDLSFCSRFCLYFFLRFYYLDIHFNVNFRFVLLSFCYSNVIVVFQEIEDIVDNAEEILQGKNEGI